MGVAVAAVDLGASSGRVMVAQVGPDRLSLHEVTRFENEPVRLPDGLHWNVLELYRQALRGLRAAARETPDLQGVAVDTWAVDYGLLQGDRLLGVPFHYRDEGRTRGVGVVHAVVGAADLFDRNGLQQLPFTTVYQLAVDPLLAAADRLLLIPDLLGHWLTEHAVTERTNASTTGLLDVRTREWDAGLCDLLGIRTEVLAPLVDPGTAVGPLAAAARAVVGRELVVSTVGSHDTASAVVAVPFAAHDDAFVSCGTWGLVGLELEAPVLTAEARAANFTNEGGVDGRTRFLTNVMGTWLLSETLRTWDAAGHPAELGTLLAQAAGIEGPVTVFDVQDPRFLPPGPMPERISAWCREHGQPVPSTRPELVRSIVHSLAEAFSRSVDRAAALTGRTVRTVNVVGGGAQNALLCQALADRSGRPVVAGPVEATALGNVLVQARALGELTGDLESLRGLVADTQHLVTYRPRRAR